MVRSIPLSPLLSLLSRGGSHGVSSILLPSLSFLRSRCHCRRGSIPTSTQGAKRDLSLSELTPAGSEVVDVDSRGGGHLEQERCCGGLPRRTRVLTVNSCIKFRL
jgi:hypothetical protein